jgi:FAD/FMN-containing dehydrogenase
LRNGVFASYQSVAPSTPIPENQKELSADEWIKFYELGHFNKARAFLAYVSYYISTRDQIYWSDTNQLSTYIDNYHEEIDKLDPREGKATEMITEVYVPLNRLTKFMKQVKADFLENKVNVFYGTIRLIKKDDESYLAWAKQDYACIIFNLHVHHAPEDIKAAKKAFRKIINRALEHGGNYYLTYHRWATKKQVLKAYPQFVEFLKLKHKYDPSSLFESDWYRRYCKMFANELS